MPTDETIVEAICAAISDTLKQHAAFTPELVGDITRAVLAKIEAPTEIEPGGSVVRLSDHKKT